MEPAILLDGGFHAYPSQLLATFLLANGYW